MKKIFSLILIMAFSIGIFGQAGIKIYTKLDEAKFKIIFDDEPENTIPIKEILYDSLDYKKPHKLIISFSADSIADIEQEYYVLKNQQREFEIVKKKEIIRKTAKVGRKIGKVLRIGNHDKEDILYDIYYLDEHTKNKYFNN